MVQAHSPVVPTCDLAGVHQRARFGLNPFCPSRVEQLPERTRYAKAPDSERKLGIRRFCARCAIAVDWTAPRWSVRSAAALPSIAPMVGVGAKPGLPRDTQLDGRL